MKYLINVIVLTFLLIAYSKAEIQDCSEFKKISKNYLECTKNNLKYKSEETGITEKVKNFGSSKTLTGFFKKIKGK